MIRSRALMILALAAWLLPGSAPVVAQPAARDLWPGTKYDPRIPTLKSVLGHDVGDEISTPEQVTIYLRALAQAAPDRTALFEYARSWEGRPLHVLVLGSPERIATLDQLKADVKKLGDPRGLSPADAERLVKTLPVVVWLMHAVHGNEISSSDAALAEAYHLLAAVNDPLADAVRRDALVLIDPLQNPDGRARFVAQHLLGRASVPDAEPGAAEHDEPWPGGRANHYLFDMNRDWFSQSQPETRGRTALYLEYLPQVVVDLHEMGGDSTYYFAPPADPLNPYITKAQAGWFEAFGRENGRAFDERGFAYFNREVFDSFYPGYGESWPIFHGAIGMTYEQASARGLVWRRSDRSLLTYRDGVMQHLTAALTTCHTAARNREKLVADFLEYRRSAVADGERGAVRAYLLPPGGDPPRTERLARLLARQGFEVRRADAAFALGTTKYPEGTFVVPAAQPSGRLLRNLMDDHVPQPEAFVKEQDRRRKKRLPDQMYDVTAWSLPLAFDVEVVKADRVPTVQTSAVTADATRVVRPLATARVGYLLPWGSGTAAAVAEALREGLKVRTADLSFTLGGRRYLAGTAIVRTSDHGADLATTLGAIVSRHGVEAVPIDSSFTESGISLGSNEVATLEPPKVLLAWDAPTSSLAAGWTRYAIERRFGQAVTAVRVSSLGRVDLRTFNVIVLPSGQYAGAFGNDAVQRLKDWVNAGGTLVTLAEASRWAARDNVGLLDAKTEWRGGKAESEATEKDKDAARKGDPPAQPIDFEKIVLPERERPENTPGAMLRVTLDPEHWLSAGTDGEIQVIVEGQRVFTPVTLDKGRNVGVYRSQDALVAGGLVWDEAQAQLAKKAYLVHQPMGRGHVIAFAEDPNYRAFTEASALLFINAILLGPGH
jgi:hypothetical protein